MPIMIHRCPHEELNQTKNHGCPSYINGLIGGRSLARSVLYLNRGNQARNLPGSYCTCRPRHLARASCPLTARTPKGPKSISSSQSLIRSKIVGNKAHLTAYSHLIHRASESSAPLYRAPAGAGGVRRHVDCLVVV